MASHALFSCDWLALWILGVGLVRRFRAGFFPRSAGWIARAMPLAWFYSGWRLVLLRRHWGRLLAARPLFLAPAPHLCPPAAEALADLLALMALAGGLLLPSRQLRLPDLPLSAAAPLVVGKRVVLDTTASTIARIRQRHRHGVADGSALRLSSGPTVFFSSSISVSFLFLPGLVFSVFRSLGIGGRVAWWWMWVLPAGFLFHPPGGRAWATTASRRSTCWPRLYYAYPGRCAVRPRRWRSRFWPSALVTGAKASNIPLVLPWLAVLWLRRDARWRPRHCDRDCLIGAGCVASGVLLVPAQRPGQHSFHGKLHGGPGQSARFLQARNPCGRSGRQYPVEIGTENILPPVLAA